MTNICRIEYKVIIVVHIFESTEYVKENVVYLFSISSLLSKASPDPSFLESLPLASLPSQRPHLQFS